MYDDMCHLNTHGIRRSRFVGHYFEWIGNVDNTLSWTYSFSYLKVSRWRAEKKRSKITRVKILLNVSASIERARVKLSKKCGPYHGISYQRPEIADLLEGPGPLTLLVPTLAVYRLVSGFAIRTSCGKLLVWAWVIALAGWWIYRV